MIFEMTKRIGDKMPSRTITSVLRHLNSEMEELLEEIDCHYDEAAEAGPDGIKGEIVDCILCLLDMYQVYDPNATQREFHELARKKLHKWRSKYSDWDSMTDRERYPEEEECPDCDSTLRAKSLNEGGGVVCRNKDCGYWFCY